MYIYPVSLFDLQNAGEVIIVISPLTKGMLVNQGENNLVQIPDLKN